MCYHHHHPCRYGAMVSDTLVIMVIRIPIIGVVSINFRPKN